MSLTIDMSVLRSYLQRELRAGAAQLPTPRDFATSLAAGIAAGLAATAVPVVSDPDVLRASGSYGDPAWLTGLSSAKLAGALPAISGAALTSLDAASVASGALADGRLSSNVPLKNTANGFTAAQTVEHNAIGNALTPTLDLVLQNTTAAPAYGSPQNSPGIVFLGKQFDGSSSRIGGAGLHFKPIAGTGSTGILQVSFFRYDNGLWYRSFDFATDGPYGVQEGVSWYSHRYKGNYHVFESGLWVTKLDGYTGQPAVSRETGTEVLQVRSCAAGAAVKIQDSAGAATQVDGANLLTSATVTGTSQSMASRVGYIANNAALVTLSLPATSAVGERISVTGLGAGGWKISQAAGQTIHDGAGGTTTGGGGHADSASRWDAITLQCVIANVDWVVIGRGGAPTFT